MKTGSLFPRAEAPSNPKVDWVPTQSFGFASEVDLGSWMSSQCTLAQSQTVDQQQMFLLFSHTLLAHLFFVLEPLYFLLPLILVLCDFSTVYFKMFTVQMNVLFGTELNLVYGIPFYTTKQA